jgi:hypothetical protein
MLENPYQPPTIPPNEIQSGETGPRKRFRYRVIPATICFTFGVLGVAGWVFQAVLMAVLVLRAGPERFNINRIVIVLGGQLGCFSLFLVGGWLWLRGMWFRAVVVIVAAYGTGVAAFSGMQGGKVGDGRGYTDQFIKLAPPAEAPLR